MMPEVLHKDKIFCTVVMNVMSKFLNTPASYLKVPHSNVLWSPSLRTQSLQIHKAENLLLNRNQIRSLQTSRPCLIGSVILLGEGENNVEQCQN